MKLLVIPPNFLFANDSVEATTKPTQLQSLILAKYLIPSMNINSLFLNGRRNEKGEKRLPDQLLDHKGKFVPNQWIVKNENNCIL